MVNKLCFGFLNKKQMKSIPDSPTNGLFDLAGKVSFETAMFVLHHPLVMRRFEGNCIVPAEVPRRWRKIMMRRKWFRRGLLRPVPSGTGRVIEMVPGPQLLPNLPRSTSRLLHALEKRMEYKTVKSWKGTLPDVSEAPSQGQCEKGDVRVRLEFRAGPIERMWPKRVLEAVEDHPLLQREILYYGRKLKDPLAYRTTIVAIKPRFYWPILPGEWVAEVHVNVPHLVLQRWS